MKHRQLADLGARGSVFKLIVAVAQLKEHRVVAPEGSGSNPLGHSSLTIRPEAGVLVPVRSPSMVLGGPFPASGVWYKRAVA